MDYIKRVSSYVRNADQIIFSFELFTFQRQVLMLVKDKRKTTKFILRVGLTFELLIIFSRIRNNI